MTMLVIARRPSGQPLIVAPRQYCGLESGGDHQERDAFEERA
jgi:hypothetical protein